MPEHKMSDRDVIRSVIFDAINAALLLSEQLAEFIE